jgi:uncharacterized cupin superfamily protein
MEQLGERLLIENERVRVWEDRVEPGATQRTHTHERPYLAIVIEGTTAETVDPDGSVLRTFEVRSGEAIYFDDSGLPVTHALRNTSENDVRVVIIELL